MKSFIEGTLTELGVNEGDVVQCTDLNGAFPHLYTVGKEYTIRKGNIIREDGISQSIDRSVAKFKVVGTSNKSITLHSLGNVKIDLRNLDGTVDEELSTAFQEAAFKEGYRWGLDADNIPQRTKQAFLYLDQEDMSITSSGGDDSVFLMSVPRCDKLSLLIKEN